MKPLIGPKKIREIGSKMDIETLFIYDYQILEDRNKKYICLQLMKMEEAITDNWTLRGPSSEIYCLVEFHPKSDFNSYYKQAVSGAIFRASSENPLVLEKGRIAPPHLAYSFIQNPVRLETTLKSASFLDQLGSESLDTIVKVTYRLYPNQEKELLALMEHNALYLSNTKKA